MMIAKKSNLMGLIEEIKSHEGSEESICETRFKLHNSVTELKAVIDEISDILRYKTVC